jgi:AcrR family transcriptional regulator
MQAARILRRRAAMVNGEPGHTRARRSQAERSAATRASLLAAARELFAERGFAGAGREEIVGRAGVTRGALQHHFGDKEGLFRAVVEQVEGEVMEGVAAAALASTAPLEQLRLGCQAYLDAALDPAMSRICIIDAPAVLPAPTRQEIAARHGLGVVRDVLVAAMECGSVARQPVDSLAHALLAAVMAAAQYVAIADDHSAARADAGATIEQLIGGLAATAP